MGSRRVYVVDDEEPIRRSVSLMLKVSNFDTREFETGDRFLADLDGLPPGCALLDIRMPGLDGFQVLSELVRKESPHAVVVMTGHGDVRSAVAALRGGAVAFVEKPFSKADLLDVLGLAFARLEDPGAFEERVRRAADRLDSLSATERKVLEGLAGNRSNEEISRKLGIDIARTELARARLMDQLDVRSVSAALNVAHLAGQQRLRER